MVTISPLKRTGSPTFTSKRMVSAVILSTPCNTAAVKRGRFSGSGGGLGGVGGAGAAALGGGGAASGVSGDNGLAGEKAGSADVAGAAGDDEAGGATG